MRSGSISNRRSRSSRNEFHAQPAQLDEHIESEIALKPERMSLPSASSARAYRIGDRAQAGTKRRVMRFLVGSISNRRSRSSRNRKPRAPMSRLEHIESEIALKPEHTFRRCAHARRAYRIGDRAQAGTQQSRRTPVLRSISNRRSRSSRNVCVAMRSEGIEHIESEIALKPEPMRTYSLPCMEHIESEIALKPERVLRSRRGARRAYRIGDRAQAGTPPGPRNRPAASISNRRSRSSRNSVGPLLFW